MPEKNKHMEVKFMVVQHNLTAMNSNRMLGITTGAQAKSTEKLSSGYKINRAADDAAGLSISEKMRKQIRGLTQASSNAQDGISAVQAAEGALTLNLHVGADATANNQISVDLEAMSAVSLGVDGIRVDGKDDSNALNAIETIKAAIQKVSEQRSALGAVQNRLEHTINNLDNVVENTTAAESQIRDTDMAAEMVKYSNNNILMQAGQAMLAQANQANQGVLSLIG